MKFSALLLALNLIAAIPLAAVASDGAVSDKAEWLKQNLAAIDQSKVSVSHKLTTSDAGARSSAKKAQFRPFVANRKLPSQRDLVLQLTAQQAKLDERMYAAQGNPLSGQISEYATQSDPNSYTQGQAGFSRRGDRVTAAAGRSTPRRAASPSAGMSFPRIPEPPVSACSQEQVRPGEHMVRQAGALLVQAPVLAPDEQQMWDELKQFSQQNRQQQSFEQPAAPRMPVEQPVAPMQTRVDPGPPPFPLNLLPAPALKELVGHKRARINAPPSYFGSWHRTAAGNALPGSGFHSYLTPRRAVARCFARYAPVSGHFTSRPARVARQRFEAPAVASAPVAFRQPQVAMYAPYGQ